MSGDELGLHQQIEAVDRELAALPDHLARAGGEGPAKQLALRKFALAEQLVALTAPPAAAARSAEAVITEREAEERKERTRQALHAALERNPSDAQALRDLQDLVYNGGAALPVVENDITWEDFTATFNQGHTSSTPGEVGRFGLLAKDAGYSAAEAIQLLAALEGVDVGSLDALPDAVIHDREAFDLAANQLDEGEAARLRARGAMKSEAFVRRLEAIGKRMADEGL
jgi:hypothetical protein